VPIRYGRMLVSPFAFYRGGALIMASDLARTPNSGIRVQLCGDAHLSNFGVFGSPERRLVFDINDFDETAPGPWEWDVKRLAASFAIGGRENGFSGKERRKIVLDTVRSYREAIALFAGMSNLDVWYASLPVEEAFEQFTRGMDPKRLKKAEANVAKARTKDSMHAFQKLTHVVDGERRIISDPPLIVPIEELIPATTQQRVPTLPTPTTFRAMSTTSKRSMSVMAALRSAAQTARTRVPSRRRARAAAWSVRSIPPMKCMRSVFVPSISIAPTAYGASGPPSNP